MMRQGPGPSGDMGVHGIASPASVRASTPALTNTMNTYTSEYYYLGMNLPKWLLCLLESLNRSSIADADYLAWGPTRRRRPAGMLTTTLVFCARVDRPDRVGPFVLDQNYFYIHNIFK